MGRTLPDHSVTGDSKDRWVGMFYWQWHANLRAWSSYNLTEWLKTHPWFKDFTAHPEGGPDFPEWYWAEPLFGYYKSNDPWVIRKHLVMLADAGVDFVFMDYTNASVYDTELQTFLNIAREMKGKGLAIPKIAFFLNYEPEWKVEHLYKTWYRPGNYEDMWFKWNGKPLIMSPVPGSLPDNAILNEVTGYFTFRPTWAFHDASAEPSKWRFIDEHPQRPAKGPDGQIEQVIVSKSLGGPLWENMHRSCGSCKPGFEPQYNDQWLAAETPQGIFFDEQWRIASSI